MSQRSITVNIGGRVYPLTIAPEEEETIRRAAEMVNEHIQTLQDEYAVEDTKDLLAMTALQIAGQYVRKEKGDREASSELGNALEEINTTIRSYLSEDR